MNNIISTVLVAITLLLMLLVHVINPISDVTPYHVAQQVLRFILIVILKDIVTLGVYLLRKDTTL